MERLELSQEQITNVFESGAALTWAKNVYGGVELSEEEMAFSAAMNDVVNKAWKYGSTQAKEEIASVVLRIVEPEIFNVPSEILAELFTQSAYGEFDKVKVRGSYKNTLVARENAARTGNVDKSYIDFVKGTIVEKNLQIETSIPMSNLRRDGALGVATLAVFALQSFQDKIFTLAMELIDGLVQGGENAFTYSSAMTKSAFDEITGYAVDNCFEGTPTVIGLSNVMREACKVSGMENYFSESMKDKLNAVSTLDVYNGCQLVTVKAGRKTGEGATLLPAGLLIAICGKIGRMYAALFA